MSKEIPEMTHPLGKYWDQPKRTEISFTEKGVQMSDKTFSELSDYSLSYPSGVYPGKMWKSRLKSGKWVLRYFTYKNEDQCNIISKEIEIV